MNEKMKKTTTTKKKRIKSRKKFCRCMEIRARMSQKQLDELISTTTAKNKLCKFK